MKYHFLKVYGSNSQVRECFSLTRMRSKHSIPENCDMLPSLKFTEPNYYLLQLMITEFTSLRVGLDNLGPNSGYFS